MFYSSMADLPFFETFDNISKDKIMAEIVDENDESKMNDSILMQGLQLKTAEPMKDPSEKNCKC